MIQGHDEEWVSVSFSCKTNTTDIKHDNIQFIANLMQFKFVHLDLYFCFQ